MSEKYGPIIKEKITLPTVNDSNLMTGSIYEAEGAGNLSNFNSQVDQLFTGIDGQIKASAKDPNRDIQYLKVISQLDYNTTYPDNDTLYFINNIDEPENQIGYVVDMIADRKNIWVLSYKKDTTENDEEKEQIILWRAVKTNKVISTKGFIKIKTWNGFKDGRLTLDGNWYFDTEGLYLPRLNTANEPFVVLISINNELFGFPNLQIEAEVNPDIYEYDSVLLKPYKIAGNSDKEEEVLHVSVEKGYCSDAFKGNDQGIVIVYILRKGGNNNNTELRYIQYGFATNDSYAKIWGTDTKIKNVPPKLFSAEVRRLSDYRLGITYNYKYTNDNGVEENKCSFIYSDRVYAGTALRAELFSLPSQTLRYSIGINKILYGAVRNDNIDEVPSITMEIFPPQKMLFGETAATGLVCCFYTKLSDNEFKPITFEILNKQGAITKEEFFSDIPVGGVSFTKTELSFGNLVFTIINDFPYRNEQLNEPADGGVYLQATYKAEILGWNIISLEDYNGTHVYSEDTYDIENSDGIKLPKKGSALVIYLKGNPAGFEKNSDGYNEYEEYLNGPTSAFTLSVKSTKTNKDVRIRFLADDLCVNNKNRNYEMGSYFCFDDVTGEYIYKGPPPIPVAHSGSNHFMGLDNLNSRYGVSGIKDNFGCVDEDKIVKKVKTETIDRDLYNSSLFYCITNERILSNDTIGELQIYYSYNYDAQTIGMLPTIIGDNLNDNITIRYAVNSGAIGIIGEQIDV